MENTPSENQNKPEAPDWLIENIAEVSKNARKLYFVYIGFLAYCALTVVSTTDRQIILNETTRLPILNVEVSLNGFFILAPLISIFFFVYFQLYLQRMKGLITDLRTNYSPVEKRRLYPWMINIAEDPEPGFIGRLQKAIVNFSLWWSLPIVLILIAFWYIKKHDPILSYIVGIMPILGTIIVIWFWCQYQIRKNRSKAALFLFYIILSINIFLIFYLIPLALDGGRNGWIFSEEVCVNLNSQKLVTEPEIDYKNIFWVDLSDAHLEGANLGNTVLKRANLSDSHLEKAYLGWSVLEKAYLWGADLSDADLLGANLKEARLNRANLQHAELSGADLHYANLHWAYLQHARLGHTDLRYAELEGAILIDAYLAQANLKNANLEYADLTLAKLVFANLDSTIFINAILQEADLRGAENLTIEQLSTVTTLYQAILDTTLMEQIKEQYPHLLEKPKPEE